MTDVSGSLPPSSTPLRAHRVSPGHWAEAVSRQALGGLAYGLPGDGDALGGLPVPVLGGAACVDAWVGGAPVHTGQQGAVRWRHDGHWLHGVLDIADAATGLADAAEQAYRDVFATLQHTGFQHLLRLWNYLPRINAETGGLERYRQFNIGRQQAFLAAGHSAFEGAPAACAIGTCAGDLRVRFLAGHRAPLAVENPRQVSAYRYPDAYGPRSPTFSRAALAELDDGRRVLFISGTASIVGHTTMHVGDVRRQTEESLANIAAVRAVAAERGGAGCEEAFAAEALSYTVYVRRAADLASVHDVFAAAVGRAATDAVYLQADICRADLLVEIEAHGFAPTGIHA